MFRKRIFIQIFIIYFLIFQSILIGLSHNYVYKELEDNSSSIIHQYESPNTAGTPNFFWNYDDENYEAHTYVFTNLPTEFQSLAVEFPILLNGYCIVTGVKYRYRSYGSALPNDIQIYYFSDDLINPSSQWWDGWNIETTDYNVPYVGGPSWRTVYHHGPIFIIDNDPVIAFSCDDSMSECIGLSSDTPNQGYSYGIHYSDIFLDADFAYMVQVMFEYIPTLGSGNLFAGDISGTDYIDAYFIELTAGRNYKFELDTTSGLGNLNMRLVEFNPLTIDFLFKTNDTDNPEEYTYQSSESGTYILLIEPKNYNVDTAQYTITFTDTSIQSSADGGSNGDDKKSSPDNIDFLGYFEYWWMQAIIGGLLSATAGISVKKMYGQREKKKGISKRRREAKRDIENFENNLRSFIRSALYEHYGEEWWDKGIPSDIKMLIEERGLAHIEAKDLEILEIGNHYTIISDKENWTNIFSPIFENKETLRMNISKLKNFKNNLSEKMINEEDLNYYNIWIFGIATCFTRGKNVFFSYSTYDTKYFNIAEIAKKLESRPEIDKVFYWEISSGESVVKYMEQALRASRAFALFCTDNSLNSKAVEDEWNAAFQLRKQDLMKIIPVYVYEDFIPYLLRPLLNIRFDKDNIDEFVENLYKEIQR